MRYLFLLIPILLNAKVFMGKVEPIDEFTIYSKTAGEIVFLDKNDESKKVIKSNIKLDSKLELEKLKVFKEQMNIYNQEMKIKDENYQNIISLSGKSKIEKDSKLIEILNLKTKIQDLKLKIIELEEIIENKNIEIKNLYIKKFLVNQKDFVQMGAKLVKAYDVSKGKVIIFLSKKEIENLKDKKIFINKIQTQSTVAKIDLLTDEEYISSYKVEIHTELTDFGNIVEIEFK